MRHFLLTIAFLFTGGAFADDFMGIPVFEGASLMNRDESSAEYETTASFEAVSAFYESVDGAMYCDSNGEYFTCEFDLESGSVTLGAFRKEGWVLISYVQF